MLMKPCNLPDHNNINALNLFLSMKPDTSVDSKFDRSVPGLLSDLFYALYKYSTLVTMGFAIVVSRVI